MISARRLEKHFPGMGKELRAVMDGTVSPLVYPSVRGWVNTCYNYPQAQEQIELAVNEILGGYGVEAIFGNGYTPDAVYINMGETYATTLLYDYDKRAWEITSWGDWIEYQERHGRKYY